MAELKYIDIGHGFSVEYINSTNLVDVWINYPERFAGGPVILSSEIFNELMFAVVLSDEAEIVRAAKSAVACILEMDKITYRV